MMTRYALRVLPTHPTYEDGDVIPLQRAKSAEEAARLVWAFHGAEHLEVVTLDDEGNVTP